MNQTTEENFAKKYANDVYIVVDVESNGASVKKNSMFSIGCVAIEVVTKRVIGGFHFNVKELDGTTIETKCWNEFWSKNQKIYDSLHVNQIDESFAAHKIAEFVSKLKAAGKNVFFASDCASYDWKWFDTCLLNHIDSNPLGYTGMDIYSFAAGVFKEPRRSVWKTIKSLKGVTVNIDNIAHDHNPFNDALSQACLLVDIMRVNESLPVAYVQYGGQYALNDYFIV